MQQLDKSQHGRAHGDLSFLLQANYSPFLSAQHLLPMGVQLFISPSSDFQAFSKLIANVNKLVKLFQNICYFQSIISMFKQSVKLKTNIIVYQMKYYRLLFETILQTQKKNVTFQKYWDYTLLSYIVSIQINNCMPKLPQSI